MNFHSPLSTFMEFFNGMTFSQFAHLVRLNMNPLKLGDGFG